MTLRKLRPPGYLWESQAHAAQAVRLQIARTRGNITYPIGYHIGIQPASGRPGAFDDSLQGNFTNRPCA
eukprot:8220418-Heterocapsa_arctica.AAC.1